MNGFEIAGGSVVGRAHVLSGRGNQDAWLVRRSGDLLTAVVADGCGSGAQSEVGAWLGARMLSSALHREAWGDEPAAEILERCRRLVVGRLEELTRATAADDTQRREVVGSCFLFTLAGFAVDGRRAFTFSLGDGVFSLNGARTVLKYADDAPPYLGYALTGREIPFVVHAEVAARETAQIFVGTDGVADLARVVDLDGLFSNDRLFANPFGVERLLHRVNRACPGRGPAPLPDDTTLVILRRAPGWGST